MSILFLNQTINYKTQSTMYQPARSTPISSCLSLHRDSLLCGVDPHGPWFPALWLLYDLPLERPGRGPQGVGKRLRSRFFPYNLPQFLSTCLLTELSASGARKLPLPYPLEA